MNKLDLCALNHSYYTTEFATAYPILHLSGKSHLTHFAQSNKAYLPDDKIPPQTPFPHQSLQQPEMDLITIGECHLSDSSYRNKVTDISRHIMYTTSILYVKTRKHTNEHTHTA